MRVIRLLPNQIPQYWELIKFACAKADKVDEEYYLDYFNELLYSLLSGKAQCFVAINETREIIGLLVTRILLDRITGDNYLFLQSLYGWEKMNQDIWEEAYMLVIEFAQNSKCKHLICQTGNPKVWENVEKIGFIDYERVYRVKLRR